MKELIRRILNSLGYDIRRSSGQSVQFENFANLALAYEKRLNNPIDVIPPDDGRPALLARLLGTPPSEAYFIVQAIHACRDVPGDVCEFGVAQGATSALIAHEMAEFATKRLHLFDSFRGLPKPTDKDQLKDDIQSLGSINAYAGKMASPESLVRHRLRDISFPENRYVIHKGYLEETLEKSVSLPSSVCFAYIDVDFYEPTKVALSFLLKVSCVGSIIVVDDYDFFSTGVKTAVDEFIVDAQRAGFEYHCAVPERVFGHFVVLTRRA